LKNCLFQEGRIGVFVSSTNTSKLFSKVWISEIILELCVLSFIHSEYVTPIDARMIIRPTAITISIKENH
jgi:hypothetical protein